MSKKTIEKEDFYRELISMMDQARKEVHFYSISCCYGFYSDGLENFEKVLNGIKKRLRKKFAGSYLDVKVLIKVDRDNPIDVYASERLAQLESRYKVTTGLPNIDRNVFRELSSVSSSVEAVQFLIVDNRHILVSSIQEETYNEELDLVLNKLEPGSKFEEGDDSNKFHKYTKLFDETWEKSSPLDVDVHAVSRRKLKYVLENYKGVKPAKTERELHLLLTGYLQGKFDTSIVDLESPVADTRIDLVVGRKPQIRRHGIEVKFKPDNGGIDGLVGKMRRYHKEYENLMVVIGLPKYTDQRRLLLLNELKEINAHLIELK